MSSMQIELSTKRIQSLKAKYVTYFTDVPIQKYAAMAIERDEDTVIRWKKADPLFAAAIDKAKAEWIRKKLLESKAEFALERLESEVFGRKTSNTDFTVNLPAPIVYMPQDLPYSAVQLDLPSESII